MPQECISYPERVIAAPQPCVCHSLSINDADFIANANPASRAAGNHRDGKSRLLLSEGAQQRREYRRVALAGFGICVHGEASDLRPYHVEVDPAYAHLAPHPALFLPGVQALDGDV